jgi:flagellar hook-associated protein 2
MTTPLGGFSGLVSGLDWRTMVDQIIQVESKPMIATKAQVTAANSKTAAWKTFSGLAGGLKTAVVGLRDGTALSKVGASVTDPSVASGGTAHVAASAADGTSPGRFLVEVISLAQAEKAGGEGFASTTAALGLTGEFFVNGSRITVAATDSLAELRSKINAANSGTTATKVTATILTTSATSNRLVLGSEVAGAAGLNLKDGTTGVLRSLGLLDSNTAIKRPTSSGAAGDRFSSTSSTVKTLLGSTAELGSTSVTIGGQAVSLDLSSQSLAQVAASIDALVNVSATVASETVDGTTTYYLDVRGTTSFVDSGRVLELLGLVEGGRSSVAQQIRGAVLTAGDATTPATSATLLSDLWNGGAASGVLPGDTLTIAGTRGDGSTVALSYTVSGGDSLQTLLDKLNNMTDGFGKVVVPPRTAAATVDATGSIRLTDSVAGDSRLALSIVTHNEGGGRLDVGTFTADVTGRDRAIVTGSDAVLRVDGVTMTRDTNTVTDAVTGVTLTLQKAEEGVIATVDVARGPKDATTALNGFVTAYNAIVTFVAGQAVVAPESKTRLPLYGDSTLSAARTSLSQALLSTVQGAASDLATASSAGLSLSKDGKLSLDATKFEAAFSASYNDVQKLFAALTSATDPEVSVGGITNQTQVGTYDVVVSSPGTTGSVTGAGFGGTYADDGTSDTLTVTDTVSGFVANVSLANLMTTSDIVGALNTAFASTAKHKVVGATTVYGDVGGTVAMTTTSKWSELTASGGASLGVASGDTIGYAGIRVNGTTYSGTFSIADAATGTVGEFIAQLQQDIGTGATVSLESGRIAVESNTTGASQLALTVTPNNEGLGTLSLGAVATSVVGKGLMEVTASALGSNLVLGHRVFGSAAGFSVAFSGGGTDGTAQLGITAGSYAGTDVAGTIGSYAATGAGQTLSGATGTPVAGLTLKYAGTTARSAGQVSVAAGLGEIVGRITDGWLDATSGMLQMKSSTISAQVTRLNSQSERQQARLDRHRASLVKQFTKMEASIAKMQSQSASLTSTLNSLRAVA